jgi:hypothetical protein
MNDLIQRITNAIIRQEGMAPDYTNPGNLRGAPWRTSPVISGGFWHPETRAEGISGIAHVVALHIAEGDSLRQLISKWAPPSDNNNTAAYIQNVLDWAELPSADDPLWSFIEDPPLKGIT